MATAAWAAGVLLACGFSFALAGIAAVRAGPDLLPLACAVAAWLGAFLFLVPIALERVPEPVPELAALAAAACLAGAAAAVLLVLFTGAPVPALAGLVALMLYLGGASLAPMPARRRPAAASWVLFSLCLLAASPVWLGPGIDRLAPAKAVTDALIAINPLTHLAVAADIDFLRSDWFYRHSPLGGLRFDYPSPAAVLTFYGLACALASLARRHLASKARRPDPDFSTTSTQPHPEILR